MTPSPYTSGRGGANGDGCNWADNLYYSKKIYFKFDQYEFLLNLNVNISSNLFNQDFPISTTIAEINILENKDNFSDQEWDSLYKLSEETFVKETDSLKQGAAGAGLTDND